MIARTMDLSEIIQNLSSEDECIRHSALLLLVELSKSCYFCDEIGSVSGGVLMLVTLKYRQPVDPFALNKVDEILKNLEKSSSNIKIMAENGHWQPILRHFLEGISFLIRFSIFRGFLGDCILKLLLCLLHFYSTKKIFLGCL